MMLGSVIFFFIFIPILAFVLLAANLLFSPRRPDIAKNSEFECGFHSFRGQNRTEFSISFFIFGLLFLLFDLEILLVYPYAVSSYNNSSYGLVFVLVFLLILTAGFVFEMGKGALKIESRQTTYLAACNPEVDLSEGSDESNLYKTSVSHSTRRNFLMNGNSRGLQFKRSYSTASRNPNESLNGEFITGFVEGDGNFSVTIIENPKLKSGWSVQAAFQIKLHVKDTALLELIQRTLGVGNVYDLKDGFCRYMVTSIKDIKTAIIPHFDKYPLITQKQADYTLFRTIILMVGNKEHLTMAGLQKIISLRAAMNLGFSAALKSAFPNIVPALRPEVVNQKIQSPQWLAGFVSAEGCFFIDLKQKVAAAAGLDKSLSFRVLVFKITQHSRDAELMKSIVTYLGCGTYYLDSRRNYGDFVVRRFADLNSIIIPFFTKYPLQGSKAKDFSDFKDVVAIVQNKGHLTQAGLEQMYQIKIGMNRGRIV